MFTELRNQIQSFTDPYNLEQFMENLAYNDDISHQEYAELYGIALDLYRELLEQI